MTMILFTFVSSWALATEFCVSSWDSEYQFKESFGISMTSHCEGQNYSSDKEFMRIGGATQAQRLSQQLSQKMSLIGYKPVAQFGFGYVLYKKDAESQLDVCVLELSEKYRPGLSCSNKKINTQIYLDDLEVYKIYLSRLGYEFVSDIKPQVGSQKKHFLIYQK